MHPEFIPAATLSEAITRIGALTGASAENTRGEKRALMALRDSLGLDISTVQTGATLGAALADALGVAWAPSVHVDKTKLSLGGLNILLAGATEAYRRGDLRIVSADRTAGLEGPEWAAFQPARSKIEAVTRISALTASGPEDLGPGGKERKRVLINLADNLLPDLPQEGLSKTGLAAAIASELGVVWGDQHFSTGETIQLSGLNALLAGAERRLGKLGGSYAAGLSARDEGVALIDALWQKFVREGWWNGRDKTLWLQAQGTRQENQMEWPGFYFEYRGRDILNGAFRPNPSPPLMRFANTAFDYSLNQVWDLKAHSSDDPIPVDEVQLNDEDAVRECVARQGLGFLILHGRAIWDDDGSFKQWHDEFKGKPAKPSLSGRSRARKAGFFPQSLEAFWIPDTAALEAALASGALRLVPQGRQASGAARPDKFHMRLGLARREGLRVHSRTFTGFGAD